MNKDEILGELTLNKDISFVKDNLIFLTLSGSRAYGINTEQSDYDYRGICIPPLEYYLTMKNFEQHDNNEKDIVIYGISKFIELASNVNPNIVELLFADEDKIVYKHPMMERIIENRQLFLSKKAKHTFLGYAFAQMKRIKHHKKWIDNPIEKPLREKYGLPPVSQLTKEKINALYTLGRDYVEEIFNTYLKEKYRITSLFHFNKTTFFDYIQREAVYFEDMEEYKRYNDWKVHRNPDRALLEAKMGFDGKHMSHLFRLLGMAKEIAVEKTIHVSRPDKEFLMAIRNGEYGYDELLVRADKEEQQVNELFEKSDLQQSVNIKKINNLLYEILEDFFQIKK